MRLLVTLLCASLAFAFHSSHSYRLTHRHGELTPRSLCMDSSDKGYGPTGSLIRQGPVPYLIRLVKPDTYEAAVDKYMMKEGCSRLEAQANMDAYFMDPNGWAAQKIREKKGGQKVDYVNANTSPTQLALTAVWAVGITSLFVRIYLVQTGTV